MGNGLIMRVVGSGIDPNDCTAKREHVLEGYKAGVNGETEPVTGTMTDYRDEELPHNGNSASIVGVGDYWETTAGKGGNIKIKAVYGGCYNSNTVLDQAVYGLHPDVVKDGALIGANAAAGFARGTFTSDANAVESHILSGSSAYIKGKKINGTIKWQNKEIDDRAYATNISTWGGVVCLGVRSGHYLNGVNWIQANVPDLTAANIREGKKIGQITGTMKDYSYLATNQVPFDGASFAGVMAEGAEICSAADSNIQREALTIDENGIMIYTSKTYNMYPHLCPKKSIDFSPFREIRVTGKFTGAMLAGAGGMVVEIWNTNVNKISMLRNYATGSLAYKSVRLERSGIDYTCVVDVSNISGQAYLAVMFATDMSGSYPSYYIKRIEFFT